jgi:hypothetical protein
MESWRLVWRNGFAKHYPTDGLESLEAALTVDDPRLTQGSTTTPPPLMRVQDWPCEAADAIAWGGVVQNGGWGEATVGQAEEFFARMCFDADQRLGEPAARRWFLNWYDDEPRDSMRNQLLHEVQRELGDRAWFATVRIPDDFVKAANADWCQENNDPREMTFRLRMRLLETRS